MTKPEPAEDSGLFRPPSIEELVSDPGLEGWLSALSRPLVTRIVQDCVQELRGESSASVSLLRERINTRLEQWRQLDISSIVNATGVLLHTNLGRAPFDEGSWNRLSQQLTGYVTVEFDLSKGDRGKRGLLVHRQIAELAGAEAGIMVNNCASAVLLMLALAQGKAVIVSRGELVQIGGGFRIPDIMAQSGARLIEVGTTNRTTIDDYANAISDDTAAILKVHRSNFHMSGFVDEASSTHLSSLCRRHNLLLMEDLGSGAVRDLTPYGLPRERTWTDAIRDGVDLVSVSGDKLMGGPQAGLVAGSRDAIGRLATHPLYRVLRPGKMAIAAMNLTLHAHLSGTHEKVLPLYRLLSTPLERLRERAESIAEQVNSRAVSVRESESLAGGGTLPHASVSSIALAVSVDSPDGALSTLRAMKPAVIARVQNDQVWFDLKTIFNDQDPDIVRAIQAILP